MRILISGGHGDLANYIHNELIKLGYSVDAPGREELDISSIEQTESYFVGKQYDIVVNAAGTLYSSLIADSEPELWIRDIKVNLIGTYLLSRLAVKTNPEVKLINIASTAAFNSYKDWTSYCAAKAGVVTLSKGLNSDGYKVTVLCPGAIDTKIRDNLSINNPNIMSVPEGAQPILDAILKDQTGKLFFYRKGESRIELL